MQVVRKSLKFFAAFALASFVCVAAPPLVSAQIIEVPPGNRNDKRPQLAFLSVLWTAATQGSYEAKYRQIYRMLSENRSLVGKIKKVSGIYGLDPIHVIGAIVGRYR